MSWGSLLKSAGSKVAMQSGKKIAENITKKVTEKKSKVTGKGIANKMLGGGGESSGGGALVVRPSTSIVSSPAGGLVPTKVDEGGSLVVKSKEADELGLTSFMESITGVKESLNSIKESLNNNSEDAEKRLEKQRLLNASLRKQEREEELETKKPGLGIGKKLLAPATKAGKSFLKAAELGDAEAWSIEFFVAFHGDTWRNADQIFFERYLSDGDRDIWLESSMDTESNSLVFEFYLDSFTPEDEPLALSIPEQDVLLGPAFNYVLVNYDGEELNLNFVGNNSKHFHSHLNIENALFPGNGYNFEFGGGGIESAYTMDEVHIMTDILEYPNGFEVPNVKHDPYDETILLWHFNEIGGSIIFDSSDFGNDGTINVLNWKPLFSIKYSG